MINYQTMIQAMGEAERTNKLADGQAHNLLKLCIGRLRCVSNNSYAGTSLLKKLKRELSEFNANTGTWKS